MNSAVWVYMWVGVREGEGESGNVTYGRNTTHMQRQRPNSSCHVGALLLGPLPPSLPPTHLPPACATSQHTPPSVATGKATLTARLQHHHRPVFTLHAMRPPLSASSTASPPTSRIRLVSSSQDRSLMVTDLDMQGGSPATVTVHSTISTATSATDVSSTMAAANSPSAQANFNPGNTSNISANTNTADAALGASDALPCGDVPRVADTAWVLSRDTVTNVAPWPGAVGGCDSANDGSAGVDCASGGGSEVSAAKAEVVAMSHVRDPQATGPADRSSAGGRADTAVSWRQSQQCGIRAKVGPSRGAKVAPVGSPVGGGPLVARGGSIWWQLLGLGGYPHCLHVGGTSGAVRTWGSGRMGGIEKRVTTSPTKTPTALVHD